MSMEAPAMDLSYLDLTTTDPAYNLALEQHLFDSLPGDRTFFMLWQNDNAIIIGKHQNTLAEINGDFVREKGIRVVRRLSGGGAVYHDLGNLNFTFITDAGGSEALNFRLFCLPVLRALEELGVKAEITGRNDMAIGGKKISGNAQYTRKGRVMHHGTLLFDSDLDMLENALRVDPFKIQAKGVQSIRSRVANLRPHMPGDLDLAAFRRALLESVLRETPGSPHPLTGADLEAVERLKRERYDAWEWNYGASPPCTLYKRRRVEGCGTVEAYLTVEEGVVRQASFRGDFFSLAEPEELARRLAGCRPERTAYAAALEGTDLSRYFLGLDREQLLDLLTEEEPLAPAARD